MLVFAPWRDVSHPLSPRLYSCIYCLLATIFFEGITMKRLRPAGALVLAVSLSPCLLATLSPIVRADVSVRAGKEVVLERMRKDIHYLASDACEGRGITTKGIHLAADYIAKEFKK